MLYIYFLKTIAIDSSIYMINKAIKNNSIDYRVCYLNQVNETNFNLITAFSQIVNHLTSLNLLEDFIKNVSLKIDINGIFYFDIFNYYFFNKNSPKYEYRQLDNNVYYEINPKIKQYNKEFIEMELNNVLVEKNNKSNYELKMKIWNNKLIIDLCYKYNFKLLKISNMLDIFNDTTCYETNFRKISLICVKF